MSGAKRQHRVIIDGAHGEGGGRILRTALSLSAITGRPLRIERIRALRRNPGLAAQHLTAVRAAAALCAAQVSGDTLGSTCLDFAPDAAVVAGNYVFDVSLARGAATQAPSCWCCKPYAATRARPGDSGVELEAARTCVEPALRLRPGRLAAGAFPAWRRNLCRAHQLGGGIRFGKARCVPRIVS